MKQSRGHDRRTFLRTLAGLGALAGTAVSGAQPTLSRDPAIVPRVEVRGTLARSTTALRLNQPLALQRLSRGRPRGLNVQIPTSPAILGDPPLPSTRQRLLQTLFAGGGLNATEFSLAADANGLWQHSGPLTQVMSTDPLAGAYAAGITLTPEGCQYAPGAEYQSLGGKEPIRYYTLQATVEPDTWGKRLKLITAKMNEMFSAFFAVFFNTPGPWDDRLTYVLELSMDPFDASYEVFITSGGSSGQPWESADVTFAPTSDGTRMALLELPGSADGEGYAHTLFFRRGGADPLFTQFNWLNIVAL